MNLPTSTSSWRRAPPRGERTGRGRDPASSWTGAVSAHPRPRKPASEGEEEDAAKEAARTLRKNNLHKREKYLAEKNIYCSPPETAIFSGGSPEKKLSVLENQSFISFFFYLFGHISKKYLHSPTMPPDDRLLAQALHLAGADHLDLPAAPREPDPPDPARGDHRQQLRQRGADHAP